MKMITLLALLALAYFTTAAPSIVFPLNSQVPPVAQASQPFQFVFSESSFSSASSSISYSLNNAPQWLQLDSASRTLSGIPAIQDAGPLVVNLTATDATGSLTTQVTLVVATESGPSLGTSVAEQLSSHPGYSDPDTIILSPASPLSLTFVPGTFTNTNASTVYYAICANNTPLPSWICFDAGSLSFLGTSPQSTSPVELSQVYAIHLTASDIAGFSQAVAAFHLIIESHDFAFGTSVHTINGTGNTQFNFTGLRSDLTLDGQPAQGSEIKQAETDAPDWITFDSRNLIISGRIPASTTSQNFTVTAIDNYGDVANTTIVIQTPPSANLFRGTVGTRNATLGSDFSYDLNDVVFNNPGIQLSVDLGMTAPWLRYDSNTLTLEGHVPDDVRTGPEELNVTVSQGTYQQSQLLAIDIIRRGSDITGQMTSTAIQSPSITTTSQSTLGGPSAAKGETQANPHKSWIAAAVILPLAVVVGIAILVYCHSRCKERHRFGSISKRQISSPQEARMQCQPRVEVAEATRPKHIRAYSRASSFHLPTILTPGTNRRKSQQRFSRIPIHEGNQTQYLDWEEYVQVATSTADLEAASPQARSPPVLGMAVDDMTPLPAEPLTYSSRRHPRTNARPSGIVDPSPAKRESKQLKRGSDMSFGSSGLWSFQRASGAGHGKGGASLSCPMCTMRSRETWTVPGNPCSRCGYNGAAPHLFSRQQSGHSWTTTNTTNESSSQQLGSEYSYNIASAMGSFPRPPTSNTLDRSYRHQTIPELEDEFRFPESTIRTVTSPSQAHLNISPRRKSYLRRRARNRNTENPFLPMSARISSYAAQSNLGRSPSIIARSREASLKPEGGKQYSSPYFRRHPTQSTQRSHSQSSSLCPSTKPSLPKKSPRRLRTPGFKDRISRFARENSNGSSQRYQSTDSVVPSEWGHSGDADLLEEGVNEFGEKRWSLRHPGHPNPLATHGMSPELDGTASSDPVSLMKDQNPHDRETIHLHRWSGSQRRKSRDEESRMMVGDRAKRALNIDASNVLRPGRPGSLSMKGDVIKGASNEVVQDEDDGRTSFI